MTTVEDDIGAESDIDRAFALYDFLAAGGDSERLVYLIFPGNPLSKHRARHGGGQTYTAAGQKEAEATLGNAIREAVGSGGPYRGNVSVGCIFYRQSQQSVDVDNLLKHVLDSANGVAWLDDRQVTAVIGVVEYDPDYPRTVIVFGRHESTLVRDTIIAGVCEVCGVPFEHPSWRKRKQRFCSSGCNARSRGQDLSEPVSCRQCGSLFKRRTVRQLLCSETCRVDWLRSKRKAERQVNHCLDCGAELPRSGQTGASRCRRCWKKARKMGLA